MLQAQQILQERYQLQRQLGRTAETSLFSVLTGLTILMFFLTPLVILFAIFIGERTHIRFDSSSCEIERETLGFKYGKKSYILVKS